MVSKNARNVVAVKGRKEWLNWGQSVSEHSRELYVATFKFPTKQHSNFKHSSFSGFEDFFRPYDWLKS